MKLSIVVPCYNEEKNIPILLERFANSIENRNVEVILVNNGSTDNSDKVLDKLLPRYSFAKKVYIPVNQGYGYGILMGLKECRGDYIGWTHADLQTDPSDVMKAYDIAHKYGAGYFIKGNRKGRPLFDQIFTVGMSIFETIYMKEYLYDINAQPNIFPRKFFMSWKKPPYDFALDLYVYYMAKKRLKIIRFPVKFPKRIHGSSSWNHGWKSKGKFIKRTLDFSKQLKKEGIR